MNTFELQPHRICPELMINLIKLIDYYSDGIVVVYISFCVLADCNVHNAIVTSWRLR